MSVFLQVLKLVTETTVKAWDLLQMDVSIRHISKVQMELT